MEDIVVYRACIKGCKCVCVGSKLSVEFVVGFFSYTPLLAFHECCPSAVGKRHIGSADSHLAKVQVYVVQKREGIACGLA